jgi:outer membrane protein assembly factor BamB
MRRSLMWLLIAGMLVAAFAPAAEAVSVRWTAHGGRAFTDVARAPDGSLYVAGIDRSSITAAASLRKYKPNGDLRWEREWVPSPQDSTNGLGVAVGSDGTVYLLGVVRAQCEGQGWFVRAYKPDGTLRWKYVTPGWQCSIAEFPTGIDVRKDLVVVSGFTHGCCGDQFHDGWVTAFTRHLDRRWRANVEPPAPTPPGWFDTALGVGISRHGSVFASGWAATAKILNETSPTPGTPILEKIGEHGARIWSERGNAKMPTMFLPVPVGVGARRVVIAAGVGGKDVSWGASPTTGWVASYSFNGDRRWSHKFAGGRDEAAAPTGVSLDADGRSWILGTRRDASDRGTDGFVRVYGPKGSLGGKLRIDRADRYLRTGGIEALGTGAASTAWVGDQYRFKGGRLWRLAA